MYYLLKGYVKAENDENDIGSFDWVVEANSIEEAKAQLTKNDVLEEIREISVEERIEREEKEIRRAIKFEYLERRFGDCTVKEFSKKQREMSTDPETYYKALVEYNKIRRLIKYFSRQREPNKITFSQFFESVNKLIDAKNEEEFNSILRRLNN